MSQLVVTSSWDDGDVADLRLAGLLRKCGLRATFYVPLTFRGQTACLPRDLRSLACDGFEIGSHTVTHRELSSLTTQQVRAEVRTSKNTLEQSLGLPVRSFCYPMGRYNALVLREVQEAGYTMARTTRMLHLDIGGRFEMPTTIQAYPHGLRTYLKNLLRGHNLPALANYLRMAPGTSDWVTLGEKLFDAALRGGGYWHLYGHSWEIEELNLWADLERLLRYVGGRKDVVYATNSEAVLLWQSER